MSQVLAELGLRAERRNAAGLVLTSLAETLPVLVSGYAVSRALDTGFLAHRPWAGFGWLAALLGCLLIRVVANRYTVRFQAELAEGMRQRATVRVVTASVTNATLNGGDRARHDVVARLVSQVESVRRLTGALMVSGLNAALTLLVSLAGLALLNITAFAVCVPLTLGALLLLRWQTRPLVGVNERVIATDEATSHLAGTVAESLRDVLAAGGTERARGDLRGAVADNARVLRELARTGVARGLVVAAGGYGPLLVVLLLAPHLVSGHVLGPGEVVGLIMYVNTGLVPALRSLSQSAAGIAAPLVSAASRLAVSSVVPEGPVEGAGRRVPRHPALRADGVGFGYRPGTSVLSGLTLDIPYGTHLTVVGTSGVGKSTLAHLLAGLVPPDAGTVTLDGIPLADLDRRELRTQVAVVPQEPYVFAGSLRENLRYLAPDAEDDAVWHAVRAVGAEEIVTRAGGLDAEISRQGLTPGEQQMIVLARVHLSAASVVVLDEATSNVPPALEARAEDAFRSRPGTLVVVAHRMSSAVRADVILVMDGASAMTGSHEELLAASPRYGELVGIWNGGTGPGPVRR